MTRSEYESICSLIRELISGTEYEGHVFVVGGSLRDIAMDRDIKDIDLAVDLPNGGITFAKWLRRNGNTSGEATYFEKFGTARLHLSRFPDEEIEVVQTRKEKYTKKTSRCPEVVCGTIEEDCMRRDFTVNTLYYDISRDRLLDMTGKALGDIEAGILRTPEDPDRTFDDDPVRILRCLRFSVRFGWKIDPDVFKALRRNIGRLEIVSKERFVTEMTKMMEGNSPARGISVLAETGALDYFSNVFREMVTQSQENGNVPGLLGDSLRILENVTEEKFSEEYIFGAPDRLTVRLAALLSQIGKLRARVKDKKGAIRFPKYELTGGAMARRTLRSMKFEREVSDNAGMLIELQHATSDWGAIGEDMTDRALRKFQGLFRSGKVFEGALALGEAAAPEAAARFVRIRQRTREMMEEGSDGFRFQESEKRTARNKGVRHIGGEKRRGRKRKNRRRDEKSGDS